MNTTKYNLVLAGFLAIFLAGCFNPASADFSSHTEIPAAVDAGSGAYKPYTVTIRIGDDTGTDRSVAGPDSARIKGEDIRNFIQVIVLNSANEVVAMDEDLRSGDDDSFASLRINSLQTGDYKFLLLQGHWERDYTQGGPNDYKYKDEKAPTLLAVGLKDITIQAGNNSVPITVYPLWVDTKFISASAEVEPNLGVSPKTELTPGTWRVQWAVKRGTTGENGFISLNDAKVGSSLFHTQDLGSVLRIKGPGESTATDSSPPLTQGNGTNYNEFTLTIPSEATNSTARIGTEGSANFNLRYTPFSQEDTGKWKAASAYFSGGVPEWIIRNGVNDAAQDDDTDFEDFGIVSGKNGNGAVAFNIVEEDGEDNVTIGDYTMYKAWYVKSDGDDNGPGTKAAPFARVQAALTRMAHAYSAGWPGKDGNGDVGYGGIVILDEVEVLNHLYIDNRGSISYPPIVLIDDPQSPGGKIQATSNIRPGYMLYFFAAQITLAGDLVLEGLGPASNYKIGGISGNENGVFTMDGGRISGYSQGVRVQSGTLIMNGGEISNNFAENNGASGVYVNDGTFIMNGGEISWNSADHNAGGVLVGRTAFIMNGGEIHHNSAMFGGGVYVVNGSFSMGGGRIYGNIARETENGEGKGGGVFIKDGPFTMITMNGSSSGQIYGNSGDYGGGVYVNNTGTFGKNGGTIYGYDGDPDGSYNNTVKKLPNNPVSDSGHAIYIEGTSYRKETTVRAGELYYNYPNSYDGFSSGWD